MISLKTYANKMKECQENMYYITGDSNNKNVLEKFKRKGFEVLLMANYLYEDIVEKRK